MVKQDPYDTADGPFTYVCNDCDERVEADKTPGKCPKCGGVLKNISIASNE